MTLRDEILSFEAFNEQEEKDKQILLGALENDTDCFNRSVQAHFTCSAWVVDKERENTVMVFHNIYKSWSWIGGHADGCEDLQVPWKKAPESPIFSLEVLTVDGHEKHGQYVSSHLHLNVTYLVEADKLDPLRKKPDENSSVKWVPLKDVISLSDEPWIRERIYAKLLTKLAMLRQ